MKFASVPIAYQLLVRFVIRNLDGVSKINEENILFNILRCIVIEGLKSYSIVGISILKIQSISNFRMSALRTIYSVATLIRFGSVLK